MVDFSELVPEEKHRVLICCMIGLAAPDRGPSFPNPLYELGYEVAILEWDTVLNSKGRKVSPDLVLIARDTNHAMVVECKSNKLEKDQIKRYMDVKREDIIDWGMSSSDPRQLVHDITLVSSYENSGRILATLPQWECIFPTLEVGIVAITIIENEFSRDELNSVFPINALLSYTPQYLYPLGRESPDYIVMDIVLQGLLSRLLSSEQETFELSLKDLIVDIYPYWNEMGKGIKEKVIRKIQRVIETASKKDFERYIEYDGRKIRFKIPNYKNTRALQAFRRTGTEYIKKLKKKLMEEQIQEFLDDYIYE